MEEVTCRLSQAPCATGQGGGITWPDNLAWSQNDIPQLSSLRTVITVLWDGEALTGTTALAV